MILPKLREVNSTVSFRKYFIRHFLGLGWVSCFQGGSWEVEGDFEGEEEEENGN